MIGSGPLRIDLVAPTRRSTVSELHQRHEKEGVPLSKPVSVHCRVPCGTTDGAAPPPA